MLCATHNHWNTDTLCSVCHPPVNLEPAAGEPVTAAVISEPAAIHSGLQAGDDIEDLAIPPFLQRAKDGSFLHPELHKCGTVHSIPITEQLSPVPLGDISDARLNVLVSDPSLTLEDRQPIYREMKRRQKQQKARERIAKMKEKMGGKSGE